MLQFKIIVRDFSTHLMKLIDQANKEEKDTEDYKMYLKNLI